jgi:adenosylcobyric acid synthase
MPAKTLMVQGTASSVGKSILVAALCRIFLQDGFRVAPFKSQNMALNSFVTREGGEIGRAQAVQAEAAGVLPTVDMNPILLKPEADHRSQVIVSGKVMRNLTASEYYEFTPTLIQTVEASLSRLRSAYDIVMIEGAGSPAEVNLKEREIVNMRVAKMADAPVVLVGDIDRGGVFASIVGTLELLDQAERDLVKGFIINKFRGDVSLLRPGLDILEKKCGRPVLGVVPYIHDLGIAQEDSVFLDERPDKNSGADLDIAVIHLPYTSNYDDFDPFEDRGCRVRYVSEADELGSPDLIIVPGTKTTIADLKFLRQRGLALPITRLARTGTPVIGICGGYQILGKRINDPQHVESREATVEGLGLLDVETTFAGTKTTTQVKARVVAAKGMFAGLNGVEVAGYEIHMGRTEGDNRSPFHIFETPQGKADYADGSVSDGCSVLGSYIHGLFHNTAFTDGVLAYLMKRRGLSPSGVAANTKDPYDALAAVVKESLDMQAVYRIAGLSKRSRRSG